MFNKRFLSFSMRAVRFALASAVARVLALVLELAALFSIGTQAGSALEGSAVDLAGLAGAVLACAAGAFLLTAASRWLESRAAAQVQAQVTSEVLGKLIDLGEMRESAMGDARAISLLGEGVEMLKPYVSRYLPQFVFAVAAPVVCCAVLAPMCPPASVAMLVCVFLMPVAIMAFMRRAKSFMGEYWGSYVDLGASFLDAVKGLSTLRSFGSDDVAQRELDDEAERFRQITMRLLKAQLASVALMDLFTYGGIALGVVLSMLSVAAGSLTVGQAVTVVLVAPLAFAPMRAFGSQFHTGMNAGPVIDELFELLDTPQPQRGTALLDAEQVRLELRGAGFAYGGDGKNRALEGVDLEIWPNSLIGVVGPSGSGKSTLARLVSGELSVYDGSVTCNGIELRDLAPDSLHRMATVVSRRSHVFKGSFRSNLLIAAPHAGDAALWEALRQAHLDEFVLGCGGLDALVDAEGASLSGGQRQRLCFARALLRNTPVYVFDEATSNVDAQSEQILMAAILKLAMKKTVIIATHRLAQLRYADEIVVLDQGRVSERGTYGELMAHAGAYRAMWERTAELERFASEVTDELPPEKPSALQEALSKMPGMMQGIMGSFVSIIQAERYGNAGGDTLPSGHPAWIPLPDYKRGMSREAAGCEDAGRDCGASAGDAPAAEARVLATKGDAPSGMGGFVEATLGDVDEDEAAQIKAAMEVVADQLSKPVEVQVRVERTPVPKRSLGQIVAGLAGLTRDMLGELACSCALGLLAHLAALGVGAFGACAVLAAASLASLPLPAGVFAALAGVCALARGPLHYAQRLLTHDQTFKTLARVRSALFAKLRRLPVAMIESRDAAQKLSLLTSGVELLEGFYSRALSPVVSAALLAVLVVLGLGLVHPLLAAVALAAYLVIGVALPALSGRLTRDQGAELHAYSVLMGGFVADTLEGMGDLARFGRAEEYREELDGHMESLGGGSSSFARLTSVLGALPHAFGLAAVVLFAVAALMLAQAGAVGCGAAVVALVAFAVSLEAIEQVSKLGFSLHQTLAAADRVLDVLDEDEDERGGAVELEGFEGLEVRDVSFGYDGVRVLEDISFTVEAESYVGIEGRSGAGKSTLLRLIAGACLPDEGEVCINGVPTSRASVGSLCKTVGYMPQETYLFAGSLRRNLLVAKPDASEEELMAAVRAAALEPLVAGLRQGLDTAVSGCDGGLSDGERQRLGLARVFLCGAPLLLLDEPTSNLDALNEAAVLRALCAGAQGKTVVVVSHRKGVAAIVDKLLVLDAEREV